MEGLFYGLLAFMIVVVVTMIVLTEKLNWEREP